MPEARGRDARGQKATERSRGIRRAGRRDEQHPEEEFAPGTERREGDTDGRDGSARGLRGVSAASVGQRAWLEETTNTTTTTTTTTIEREPLGATTGLLGIENRVKL